MRIVLNVDIVPDPNNCTKRKLRLRTSYKDNSDDSLTVTRLGRDVYAFIKRCLNVGLEGALVEHEGEQR